MRLRYLQNTNPFEQFQQEIVSLEDTPGLPTVPDDKYEDAVSIVDNVNILWNLLAPIFQWRQCRRKTKDHLRRIFIFS